MSIVIFRLLKVPEKPKKMSVFIVEASKSLRVSSSHIRFSVLANMDNPTTRYHPNLICVRISWLAVKCSTASTSKKRISLLHRLMTKILASKPIGSCSKTSTFGNRKTQILS